jgi:rubrerythrin
MNSPKVVAEYLSCLSILEESTALLYRNLSDRIESPALIKSLLLSISQDSSKHSTLIKSIAESIYNSKIKHKNCAKKLGSVWSTVSDCLSEVAKEDMETQSFWELLLVLDKLESNLGEEYYIFVQMQTLQFMVKEINKLYDINLERVKHIFENIIRDEEHHKEILTTIKDIIGESSTERNNTPKVKYQNPEAWISHLPPTTYNST